MTRDYDDRGTFNDKTNTTPDIDINDFTPTTGSNFELHKRIKALEDSYVSLNKSDSYAHSRVKALEDSFPLWISDDIKDRIKALEEWQKSTGGSILARIKFLEEWKKQQIHLSQDMTNRIEKLEQRNYKWEEWKQLVEQCNSDESAMKGMYIQELQNKVKALEKWKEGLGEEVHKLDHVMILNRIDKLEEWKRGNIKEINDGQDFKVMDKKIWDNIKLRVRLLSEYGCPERIGGGQNYNISELIELVKQVDPDCKPSDRLPNPSGDMCVKRKIKIDREVWEGIKSIVSQMRGHTCIPWAYQRKLDEIVKKVET